MAIFLSYRRDDSIAIVGRIDDYLRAEFGNDGVYRDLEDIPLGIDFVQHLEHALSNCDVLVAIIGPRWLTDRLQKDDDFVRGEIEAALRRNIPTIPVLVEGARLPSPEQLPPNLQPLLRRQTLEIESGSDFKSDIARLAAGIRRVRGLAAPGERRSLEPLVRSSSAPKSPSARVPWWGLALLPVVAGTLWFALARARSGTTPASPALHVDAPATDSSARPLASVIPVAPPVAAPVSVSFQNGVAPTVGYAGATDSSLEQSAPKSNLGDDPTLYADGDDGSGVDLSALIRWSLSDIPKGSVVQSASITLHVTNGTPNTYALHGLLRPWSDTQVTWRQATSSSRWAKPGAMDASDRGVMVGSLTGVLGSNTIELNRAGIELVQSWLNDEARNAGIIIASPSNANGLDIASSEHLTASVRPKLTITYLPPI